MRVRNQHSASTRLLRRCVDVLTIVAAPSRLRCHQLSLGFAAGFGGSGRSTGSAAIASARQWTSSALSSALRRHRRVAFSASRARWFARPAAPRHTRVVSSASRRRRTASRRRPSSDLQRRMAPSRSRKARRAKRRMPPTETRRAAWRNRKATPRPRCGSRRSTPACRPGDHREDSRPADSSRPRPSH